MLVLDAVAGRASSQTKLQQYNSV